MNTLNKIFKNSITALILTMLLVLNTIPVAAIEAPTPPTAPSAPEAPSAPTAPTAPTSPDQPSPDDNDDENHDSDNNDDDSERNTRDRDNDENENTSSSSSPSPTPTASPSPTTQESQQQSNSQPSENSDQVGDTEVDTGNATTTGTIVSEANNNLAATGESSGLSGESSGTSIVNSGNGTNSDNSGSVSTEDTTNTIQDNSAAVNNDLELDSNSGNNDGSGNVGNTTIDTGDANVSGTIVTTVNTNADGIMVSEFNVEDDHMGDLVLDFAANCIAGCGGGDALVKNTGNGSNSTNNAELDQVTNDNTFQNNDANIGNNMVLFADSGNNTGDNNTGGNTEIDTGDANVSANVLTFANNNLAGGNIVYGVVNIYGDLVGDIVFPEEMLGCCGGNTTVANVGNGSGSTNTGDVSQTTTDNTFQSNDATIDNVLVLDATTGDNDANDNTGGNTEIKTGNSDVTANVLNVANSNVAGDWWLVLVNEAGQWIGRILGSPDGSNYAGSAGTEFSVNPNGEITAVNSGNGSNSTNNAAVSTENNTTTVQNNDAHIVNNVQLGANTGGNSTSGNTGGNNSINTGDANIVANLVNFVNNNIVGGGKLFVTVVNVFGSWVGDFVAPGQEQQENTALAANTNDNGIGGADVGGNNSQTHNSDSNVESNSNNTNNGGETSVTTAAAIAPTATPTPTPKNGTGGNVLAFGGTSQTGGTSFENISGALPDAVITPPAVVAGRQIVRVNLAWLLIIIPCAIIGAFVRRMYKKLASDRILSTRIA